MNTLKMVGFVLKGTTSNFFDTMNSNRLNFFFTDLYADNDNDDVDCQEEYEIIEIAANRYKTTFHVPQ